MGPADRAEPPQESFIGRLLGAAGHFESVPLLLGAVCVCLPAHSGTLLLWLIDLFGRDLSQFLFPGFLPAEEMVLRSHPSALVAREERILFPVVQVQPRGHLSFRGSWRSGWYHFLTQKLFYVPVLEVIRLGV